MPRCHLSCLSMLILATCATQSFADNWPRFRGPNGTGVADDKNIPVQFDGKSGKNILWKVPLPGFGLSSPVVWDKHLFIQSATKNQRLLICLDAVTGKLRWTQPAPGAPATSESGPFKKYSSYASSTPATDGQVVVTVFYDGSGVRLVAFNIDGTQLWDHDFGKWTSQHGPAASPVIYKDKVIYVRDMDAEDDTTKKPVPDAARIWAFDKMTGKMLWNVPREAHRACYSAPFILNQPGQAPELIVTSTTGITSYNPADGKRHWEYQWTFLGKMPLRTTASSIVANGMLFACSGDGGGDRHMVAFKLPPNGNAAPPETAWQNRKDFPYVPTPLCRGEHLYFVNDRGFAGCYEAATGKAIWFKRLAETSVLASPVLIDGKMYAATESGDVYVLAAEPKYQVLARNELGESIRATPAVANDRLYIRGQKHLFCIGQK